MKAIVYANHLKSEDINFGIRVSTSKISILFACIHFWKHEWYMSIEPQYETKVYDFEVTLED